MCDICNIKDAPHKLYIYNLCDKCNTLMENNIESLYKLACNVIIDERVRKIKKNKEDKKIRLN